MSGKAKDKKEYFPFLLLGLLVVGMLPWLVFDANYALRTDVAWHVLSSSRFIEGGTMSQDFSETNPPLIILVYAIPALLSAMTNIPVYYFPFYMMLILNIASAFMVYRILKTGKIADEILSAVIGATSFIAMTLITAYETGQREHLIITGLLPFFLAQYTISKQAPVPKGLLHTALIFGGILILIKPHYGLVPTLVFAVRALQRGVLAVIKSPDFIILSILTASYILVCLTFFMDYITQILPDVIDLYVPYGNSPEDTMITGVIFAVIIVALSVGAFFQKDSKNLTGWILFAAFICLAPPLVQGKGFIYHFLPSMVLVSLAVIIMTYEFLRSEIKQKAMPALFAMGMALGAGYFWHSPNPEFPTHENYAQRDFPEMLNKYAQGGHFITVMDNIGLSMPSALYTTADSGMRHPSLWFLTAFAQENADQGTVQARLGAQELYEYKEKYARLMVEDLRKYKPEIITVTKVEEGWPEIFEKYYVYDFFEEHEELREEWSRYEFFKEVVIPKKDYFGGLDFENESVFTIYKRKSRN